MRTLLPTRLLAPSAAEPARDRPDATPIWMSALDGLEHAVAEREMTSHSRGVYRTVCGRTVLPLPMTAPAHPGCRRCRARWQEQIESSSRHGHRRQAGRAITQR